MSKKEIVTYPSKTLRKETKEVSGVEEVEELLSEMKEILKEEDGIGLAAPQVGVNKQVFVIKDGAHYHGFMNPEIVEKSSEEVQTTEGCLSFPGLWLDIDRSQRVEVEALAEDGERVRLEAEKAGAVVFQHEIDHLSGTLFIDQLSFLERITAKLKYFLTSND